jgi:ADP-heptose:LPS heptosyltransferase
MKNTLIINLKRFGDIFQTAHLIATIKEKQPGGEIHLLCYEEAKRAAKAIKGISKIHTINRKKVISFFNNSIYSDGLALNELEQTLDTVAANNYDRVINYSNDKVGTYLTSYLAKDSKCETVGINFTSKQTINYSNSYAVVLNDVLTQSRFTPYNYNDVYHHLIDESFSWNVTPKLRSNNIHDNTARNNLNRLRANKSEDAASVSVVGVQITASSNLKELPFNSLVETIRLIEENPKMVPILLLAPTAEERALANKINAEFNNRLVSVEADFIALPSVLKNIEVVLTPDTAVKHMADLAGTPVLELSLGFAPLFKQGSVNPNSLIISRAADKRTFSESLINSEVALRENAELSPNYIYEVLKVMLEESPATDSSATSQFCTYKPQRVVDGTFHMPVSGPFNMGFEAKRVMARAIIQKTNKGIIDENLIESAYQRIDKREFQRAIEEEKLALATLTKELLSTLRGLIQTQENKNKAPAFIEALEKLLARCFDNNLAAIHALQFRAKIESLNSSTMEENFKEVEGLLYQLKDNLQSSMFVFKACEEIGNSIGRNDERSLKRERTL